MRARQCFDYQRRDAVAIRRWTSSIVFSLYSFVYWATNHASGNTSLDDSESEQIYMFYHLYPRYIHFSLHTSNRREALFLISYCKFDLKIKMPNTPTNFFKYNCVNKVPILERSFLLDQRGPRKMVIGDNR